MHIKLIRNTKWFLVYLAGIYRNIQEQVTGSLYLTGIYRNIQVLAVDISSLKFLTCIPSDLYA